jgi:hypothetical protein
MLAPAFAVQVFDGSVDGGIEHGGVEKGPMRADKSRNPA